MRAISAFSREFGTMTSSWAAWMPLRIRVRKSAMGSVIDMALPARLRHAGDEALVRELAQADAADAELAVHGPRTPAAATARVGARWVLRRARLAHPLGCLGHVEVLRLSIKRGRARRSATRTRRDGPHARRAGPGRRAARTPRRRSARSW